MTVELKATVIQNSHARAHTTKKKHLKLYKMSQLKCIMKSNAFKHVGLIQNFYLTYMYKNKSKL